MLKLNAVTPSPAEDPYVFKSVENTRKEVFAVNRG